MSESGRVRLKDLRNLYLLVGECCEVGNDPYAWHMRAFEGLRRIIGFQFGAAGMTGHGIDDFHFNSVLGAMGFGYTDRRQKRLHAEYMQSDLHWSDPTFLPFLQLQGDLITRRREELVSDAAWYGSEHFNEHFRVAHLDDGLFAASCPTPESGVTLHHLILHRPLGDKAFGVRERRIIWLFLREIRQLLGNKLVPFGRPSPNGLSPRMRQVLALLAEGQSEKQVAATLQISRHTVHDYVKMLHQRLGVSSRGELLARSRRLLAPAKIEKESGCY